MKARGFQSSLGELAKFYDSRKFCRKRIPAIGTASDNIFKKPNVAWAKGNDMEEAGECEYEEKRAAPGLRLSVWLPRFARGRSRTASPGYVWMSGGSWRMQCAP